MVSKKAGQDMGEETERGWFDSVRWGDLRQFLSDRFDRLEARMHPAGSADGITLAQLTSALGAMETRIMGRFDEQTGRADKLTSEIGEIKAFIATKTGALEAALAERDALAAKLIEQEPHLITSSDREQLASHDAKVQAAIDELNAFTPDVVVPPVDPGPVDPGPVDPGPVDPNNPGGRRRK